MDWRLRRYYVITLPTFPTNKYDYYTKVIKSQPSVKLHPPTYPPHKIGSGINFVDKFDDEYVSRGYHHYIVSAHGKRCGVLVSIFNLIARECAEHGWRFMWREIYPAERGKNI